MCGRLQLNYKQLRHISFSPPPHYKIVLSWDLLDRILDPDEIPRSFTSFITTPELSGPFYISSDNYHAQITEYLLEKINM